MTNKSLAHLRAAGFRDFKYADYSEDTGGAIGEVLFITHKDNHATISIPVNCPDSRVIELIKNFKRSFDLL